MKKAIFLVAALASSVSLLAQQTASQNSQIAQLALARQQQSGGGASLSDDSSSLIDLPNPQVAMANPAYPVTAGDVYTLGYAAGTTPVTYMILVDPSYKIRVSNLAVLDARGKTFLDLKREVEAIVSKNYSLSGVQFALTSPSTFSVVVSGEVSRTTERKAWALTRLSAAVAGLSTDYSSFRDVSVRGADGKERRYDLFKAERFGDLSQDPYLRPGDSIVVGRVSRSVKIAGAVERPGRYQLLDSDTLDTLIKVYAGGFAPLADRSRIEIVRFLGESSPSGRKIYVNDQVKANAVPLQDQDAVTVTAVTELLPVLFLEGALGVDPGALVESSTRIPIRFNPGENLASLVRANQKLFSPVSDTASAYLLRGGNRIQVNLNPMLYDASYRSPYLVEDNDTLVVPFRQYFVTVSGAVKTAGRFPYIPDRDWRYYVSLAGGIDPSRNSHETVRITDMNGKPLGKTDPVGPETLIEVSNNAFLYYFNQYAPVITTVLSLITTSITVYSLVN